MTANPDPDREAAMWLVEMGRDDFKERSAEFDAWRAKSNEHARAWSRVSRTWESVNESDPLIEAMRADALSARPTRLRMPVFASAGLAAAAFVAFGIFGWQVRDRPQPTAAPVSIARDAAPTLINDADVAASTTLPDGTRAKLDGHTAIALAYTPGRRDLRLLRGQATFDVQHNPARPFAVEAGSATVTAIGTQFTVRTLPSGMVTTLERGKVLVTRDKTDHPVILRPGEQLIASAGRPLQVLPGRSPEAVARQSGYLQFDNTPLEEAVQQVDAFGNGVRIVLAPNASSLKVSGRFRLGDIDGFVNAVTQILPLRSRREAPGVVRLSRR